MGFARCTLAYQAHELPGHSPVSDSNSPWKLCNYRCTPLHVAFYLDSGGQAQGAKLARQVFLSIEPSALPLFGCKNYFELHFFQYNGMIL